MPLAPATPSPVRFSEPECWWPRTGATSLFVADADGGLLRVPDSFEVMPRNYDCALALPTPIQRQIQRGALDAWPRQVDPKCVVILMAHGRRGADHLEPQCVFWFVRLSHTPNVLRRVPRAVRARIVASLVGDAVFKRSTLVTHYADCDLVFEPLLQRWDLLALALPLPLAGRDDERPSAHGPTPSGRVGPVAPAAPATHATHATHASPSPHVCAICCERPPTWILIPCGHAVLCGPCERAHVWSSCPMCRSAVVHTNPVFT